MGGTVTANGQLLVLSRTTAEPPLSARTLDYVRSTEAFVFGTPAVLNAAFTSDDADAYVLPSGSALYFSGLSGTYRNIHRWLPKPDGAPFQNDAIVFEGMRHFAAPVVSDDQRVMFLGMGEMNAPSLASVDVYITTRTASDAPWREPTKLAVLSADNVYDAPAWLSADGCVLTLTTNRDGPSRMYVAERAR
jgi:hypothetical protein